MTPEDLIRRCHELAGQPNDTVADADSLISFFQVFRPDGNALAGLFAELDCGDALHERLQQLYAAAGDDRRPTGGRDAYFVVRNPPAMTASAAKVAAEAWLIGVREIAVAIGNDEVAEMLAPIPIIRVLEGIPPKHPKIESEQSHLLRIVRTKAPAMIESIDAGPLATTLRPAYYFTACDAMLRDYLMWPFYVQATGLENPLGPYLALWKHGAKYRIFQESQVDIYLPRPTA